jgi:hypothetical protein
VAKKIFFLLVFLLLQNITAYAADEGYFKLMKRDLSRGLQNIVTFPLEIPITMQEYHESAGLPFVRQLTGAVDGTFQGIARFGSGAWDLLAAWTPGIQEGLPVNPETIF